LADSKIDIARFKTIEVEANSLLRGQLATVQTVENLRTAIKLRLKITGVVAALAVPLSGLWAAFMLYWRYYHAYNWSFATEAIAGGCLTALIAGVISAVSFRLGRDFVGDDKLSFLFGGAVSGLIAVLGLLWALPFILPFIVWGAIVVLGIYYATWPHLGSSVMLGGVTTAIAKLEGDNRYQEYREFLQLVATWNDYAQLLNRIVLKLEHNQFDQAIVPMVEEALAAMRADQRFVEDRCAYLEQVAQEGEIGTLTARAKLGAAVVHELSGRMTEMRRRVDELREMDTRAVAALQVETGKY
jgi:hypothetical protein